MELIPVPVGGKLAKRLSETVEPIGLMRSVHVGIDQVLNTSSLCHLKN
jgi:hypothetical protein